jgi:hypothetical protein
VKKNEEIKKYYDQDYLDYINNRSLDTEIFYKLINAVKKGLLNNLINFDDKKIVYKRNPDGTSIIAIKLAEGDDKNTKNYMVVNCEAWKGADKVTCNVEMNADAKISVSSMKLSNLISRNIVEFFEEMENDLYRKNNFDISISLTIPLAEGKDLIENNKTKSKSIKNIFKRNK